MEIKAKKVTSNIEQYQSEYQIGVSHNDITLKPFNLNTVSGYRAEGHSIIPKPPSYKFIDSDLNKYYISNSNHILILQIKEMTYLCSDSTQTENFSWNSENCNPSLEAAGSRQISSLRN